MRGNGVGNGARGAVERTGVCGSGDIGTADGDVALRDNDGATGSVEASAVSDAVLTDAMARIVFSRLAPSPSAPAEFVGMPDGSFCRTALLAGNCLTGTEYDWVDYVL